MGESSAHAIGSPEQGKLHLYRELRKVRRRRPEPGCVDVLIEREVSVLH
jgi:hypothetical protein